MTYVYDFTEGDKDQKDLLGGKGANLAEMTNLGLPVPPGFTISTEACRAYLEVGDLPDGLAGEIDAHLESLEKQMGRRLGEPGDPLLVSVRSGAAVSMPGMMETVLNVGLNDESVRGLAEQSHDERFAMDSYRRLLQMFGATVLGIDSEVFSKALDRLKKDRGTTVRHRPRRRGPPWPGRDLQAGDPRARRPWLPAGPARAARAGDARGLRLVEHRARRPLPPPGAHRRGHGYGGQRAGDGVRQPRRRLGLGRRLHPRPGVRATRACTATTCRTPRARTSSPGSATPCRWPTWSRSTRRRTTGCSTIMDTLEKHYRDMCDIEFTVERGKLWMLQTRVGKRTPEAAFRIGRHMTDEGLIDTDESLRRVTRRPARAADVPALRREGRAAR